MAVIFTEGFDKYGPPGKSNPSIPSVHTLFIQGEWTNFADPFGSMAIVAPLSVRGGAVFMQAATLNPAQLRKTLPNNYGRLIAGFRFTNTLAATGGGGIVFRDSGTAQCAVTINPFGQFEVRTGGSSGGVLATSLVSISANTTHYLEVDITFATSGAYQVWLDGVSIITGTGNTKTSAHTYANELVLGDTGGANYQMTYDDFYLFDDSGSTNNAALNTNPRIETRYPNSDAQTVWINDGNVLVPIGIAQTGVSTITTAVNSPGANELALLPINPPVNCNLVSVAVLPAQSSVTAKFTAVLYSDSSGAPNTLIAAGTQVIGCVSGTALSLPFSAPQALTGSTAYWIGYITDTSINLSQYDNTTVKGQKLANTYGSGAPAGPLGGMTVNQPTWLIWGDATGAATNWESVASDPADGAGPAGDASSISSAAPGDEDLYHFPNLSTIATAIYCVGVKVNVKRSDTGDRTIDCRLKSGATDSAGSNPGQVPGTSYEWLDSYFETDPNTSMAWTASGVNFAQAGPKIAS